MSHRQPCEHLADWQVRPGHILNCPAEGWPDEDTVDLWCNACNAVAARGEMDVLQALLSRLQALAEKGTKS